MTPEPTRETRALPATFAHHTGLNACENRCCTFDLFLRGHFVARGNFSWDRFGRADRLSPSEWPAVIGVADFQWPLRTSHRNGFLQGSGEGKNSLFKHVRHNCRCAREHYCGRCRCRHAGPIRRKIYSCADALFHAIRRRGWNACRIFAGLSCVPWLCSHATTAGNCLLQFRQCRYSGDRVWQNTRWSVLGPIAVRLSAGSALRAADGSAVCAASSVPLVAVRIERSL